MENVYDLAQTDTSLKRVGRDEYKGACPKCHGTDRFTVKPDYFGGNGAWFCRQCHSIEEYKWGDGIEYLKWIRNMTFFQAKAYLASDGTSGTSTGHGKPNADPFDFGLPEVPRAKGLPPEQAWQDASQLLVGQAASRLWQPVGRQCLDLLKARGLTAKTIAKAQLGFALTSRYKDDKYISTPCLIIPWYADGSLYAVNTRDIRDGMASEDRYKLLKGSVKSCLYQGDSLKLKRPTFLVEGELDALSIIQEAGDIVACVASGGLEISSVKWLGRLARATSVFVAFDSDARGGAKAKYWLAVLDNGTRWCPTVKDANYMLANGYGLRGWVTSALDTDTEPDRVEATPDSVPSASIPVADVPAPHPMLGVPCWKCGTALQVKVFGGLPMHYCPACEPAPEPVVTPTSTPIKDYAQFLEVVQQIADATGCTVTPIAPDYTLQEHVAHLRDVARDVAHSTETRQTHARNGRLPLPCWLQPEDKRYQGDASRAAFLAGFTDVRGNKWDGHSHYQQRLINAGERLGYPDLHAIYAVPRTVGVIGYDAWLAFALSDTLGVCVATSYHALSGAYHDR